MKETTIIKVAAILAISMLEAAALYRGLDGAFFGPAIAIIGGIAGYELRGLKETGKQPAKQEG